VFVSGRQIIEVFVSGRTIAIGPSMATIENIRPVICITFFSWPPTKTHVSRIGNDEDYQEKGVTLDI